MALLPENFSLSLGGHLSAMGDETTIRMSPQDAKTSLERWLEEEGFSPTSMPQKEAKFFLVCNGSAEYPHPVYVYQPVASLDKIVVRVDISFHEDDRKRLLACDQRHREQFAWDMETQLATLGLEVRVDNPVPRLVNLYTAVYFDGLTKDRLFRSVRALYIGERILNVSFSRAVGQLLATPPVPSVISVN
jgi:hypothetical protein